MRFGKRVGWLGVEYARPIMYRVQFISVGYHGRRRRWERRAMSLGHTLLEVSW